MSQRKKISREIFFLLFTFSRAAPAACGGSQTRGLIGAVATGLRQSHSNAQSGRCLQPTSQLMATPDLQPTERGQGSNPQPHGSSLDSLTTEPQRELPKSREIFKYFEIKKSGFVRFTESSGQGEIASTECIYQKIEKDLKSII